MGQSSVFIKNLVIVLYQFYMIGKFLKLGVYQHASFKENFRIDLLSSC